MKEFDFFGAFFSVTWYNGYRDDIAEWIARMEKGENDCPLGILPHDYREACNFGQLQVLWMMLVEWLGEYGTSPRYGWIERDNLNECIEFLKKVVAKCDEGEANR